MLLLLLFGCVASFPPTYVAILSTANSRPMPNRLCFRRFVRCLVRHPSRNPDRREGDAGALNAQEVLGEGPADQGPRPGGASARCRSHHSSHVGLS